MKKSAALLFAAAALAGCSSNSSTSPDAGAVASSPDAGTDAGTNDQVKNDASSTIDEGRQTFRHETFGDEDFWGGTLGLHKAIEGAAHGGVGGGLSPSAALAAGLKVDVDALPQSVKDGIANETVDLNSPDTTLALLNLDAVIGVEAQSDGAGGLKTVGITCALCHSTVDDSFAKGVGHRQDGWANRDLNVGAVVNLAPDLSAVATLLGVTQDTVRQVLQSWGPGRFDAELFLDGQAFRPDGKSASVLIPPAFGLSGVNLHTWTGWGSVTYWNAFVAVLEMHGKGNFFDTRLDDATKFPVAAKARMGHTTNATDLVTPKLAALHFYQLALQPPAPPAGSFDMAAAQRGQALFQGAAKCATCHVAPLFTEPGWNMHAGAEIGIDDFQANRAPDGKYRTSPLRGLSTHGKGGYYHDGRFATLGDVVAHYDSTMSLGLSAGDQSDLVEYLKSL
jgi:hypothetical protein